MSTEKPSIHRATCDLVVQSQKPSLVLAVTHHHLCISGCWSYFIAHSILQWDPAISIGLSAAAPPTLRNTIMPPSSEIVLSIRKKAAFLLLWSCENSWKLVPSGRKKKASSFYEFCKGKQKFFHYFNQVHILNPGQKKTFLESLWNK